jgi:hypothetical protein
MSKKTKLIYTPYIPLQLSNEPFNMRHYYWFQAPIKDYQTAIFDVNLDKREFIVIEEIVGEDSELFEKGLTELGIFFRLKKDENDKI